MAELTSRQRLNLFVAHLLGAPTWHSCSGYSYRLELQGKPWGKFWRPRIDALPWFKNEPNHCKVAYEREIQIYEGSRDDR